MQWPLFSFSYGSTMWCGVCMWATTAHTQKNVWSSRDYSRTSIHQIRFALPWFERATNNNKKGFLFPLRSSSEKKILTVEIALFLCWLSHWYSPWFTILPILCDLLRRCAQEKWVEIARQTYQQNKKSVYFCWFFRGGRAREKPIQFEFYQFSSGSKWLNVCALYWGYQAHLFHQKQSSLVYETILFVFSGTLSSFFLFFLLQPYYRLHMSGKYFASSSCFVLIFLAAFIVSGGRSSMWLLYTRHFLAHSAHIFTDWTHTYI